MRKESKHSRFSGKKTYIRSSSNSIYCLIIFVVLPFNVESSLPKVLCVDLASQIIAQI